jgi:hypothetical protein
VNLREQAQRYADMGISVIPVWHGGKRPTRAWQKYQKQPPTAAELDMWFGGGGGPSNIAVVGGAVSGNLVVLDFDEVDGYLAWCDAVGDASETGNRKSEVGSGEWGVGSGGSGIGNGESAPVPRTQNPVPDTRYPTPYSFPYYTTGRGYHVWLRTTQPMQTCVARVNGTNHEVHLRGEGGYAIAPPSLHEAGRKYTWQRKCDGIPVVDVIPGIQPVAALPHEGKGGGPAPVDAAKAEQQDGLLPKDAPMSLKMPAWLVDILNDPIPVGKRHRKLVSVCGWARQVLHRRDCLQFMERVNKACCPEPLPPLEVRQIVESLYKQPGPTVKPMAAGLPDDFPLFPRSSIGNGERTNGERPPTFVQAAVAGDETTNDGRGGLVQGTDLAHLSLTPPDWLVDRIAQAGAITVLVAPSGCIKTWAALWWMRQVCRMEGGGQRALYVDEESGDTELARRYQKMGVGGDENAWFWFYPGLALDIPEHAEEFLRVVAHVDARFVVIDSMRRVVSGDENTSGAIDCLYACLCRLKAMGVAVLVLHHARKKGGGVTEGEMGRGSSDVKAMADTYIECYQKSGTKVLVKWNKMRSQMAPEPQMLVLREEPDLGQVEVVWTDEDDEERRGGTPDDRILAAVNGEPGLGIRELAAAASVSLGETSRLVRALVAERKLDFEKQGKKKAVYPGPQFPGAAEREEENA